MRARSVHRQLLDIGQRVPYEERTVIEGYETNGQPKEVKYEEWSSHSGWRPHLDILRTVWTVTETDTRLLTSAIFAVDDFCLTADATIRSNYLNEPQGLEHLEEFRRYFTDAKNIALHGMVLARVHRPAMNEPFTSTKVEMDIFQAAKV